MLLEVAQEDQQQLYTAILCTLSETAMTARPVGSESAFCEPVTATSTPHLSISNGSAPMDDTPSTCGDEALTQLRMSVDGLGIITAMVPAPTL